MRILIKHIKARLPDEECSLKFMVKEKTMSNLDTPSLYPLSPEPTDLDISVKIDLEALEQTAELIAVAVTEKDRIFLGKIDIEPNSYGSLKQNLKGISDQKGYLQLEVFEEGQTSEIAEHEEKTQKHQHRVTPNTSHLKKMKFQSPNQNKTINSPESWPQLGTGSIPQTPEAPEYKQLAEDLQKWILEEKLKNQQYWNRIQQNQIFSLKYKSRMEALLEQTTL